MCIKYFYVVNYGEWITIKHGYPTYHPSCDMIRMPMDASNVQSRKFIKERQPIYDIHEKYVGVVRVNLKMPRKCMLHPISIDLKVQ